MRQKRFHEAVTAFEKAIELKPTAWEAYFNLASAYIGLKRKAEAAVALTNAMVIAPHRREEMLKQLVIPGKQE
jgi:Flp pilus assembly protein TadD